MSGRAAVLLLATCFLIMPPGYMSALAVGAGTPVAPGGPDLKITLEKGLKARRPSEFAFIALVIGKVNDGTLPLSLVESTFLWARKQRPYPTVYFERGLKARARKLGIAL